MKKHPSLPCPVACSPETEVAYVADSEGDAQALERQMGDLVEIRFRVVEEVPYRRERILASRTSRTFSAPKRSSSANTRTLKKSAYAAPHRLAQ